MFQEYPNLQWPGYQSLTNLQIRAGTAKKDFQQPLDVDCGCSMHKARDISLLHDDQHLNGEYVSLWEIEEVESA